MHWSRRVALPLALSRAASAIPRFARGSRGTSSAGDKIIETASCDMSFMQCIPNEQCARCYMSLSEARIPWATVTSETQCSEVLDVLAKQDYCEELKDDASARGLFCSTFEHCVVWIDEDLEDELLFDVDFDDDEYGEVDCDELAECDWPGFEAKRLGNGICNTEGCYNSKACEYDGGDCCEDKCESPNERDVCGTDRFFCIDPDSAYCNSKFSEACPQVNNTAVAKCEDKETKMNLIMYDSFGDGWGMTKIDVKEKNGDELGDTKFQGSLKDGKQGNEFFCVEKGCYSVKVSGGVWGEEATWEMKLAKEGGPSFAYGSAPTDCTFSVGGNECDNTCDSKTDDAAKDESFQSYADLQQCLKETCVIQLNLCEDDPDCSPCLNENIPAFCVTNGLFAKLTQCSLCHCAEGKEAYCGEKSNADVVPDAPNNAVAKSCNPEQTLAGSGAIFKYSKCSDIETVSAMMEDWDVDNFGGLDSFEACSHTYTNEYLNGGKNPLDCMRILVTIQQPESKEKEAVKDIAKNLYKDGPNFCECVKTSDDDCPNCSDFSKFKTLLRESLDACNALDEIDCPAWNQFAGTCKESMMGKFGDTSFTNQVRCDYVAGGCGGALFPSFRRLDCDKEIPKSAWDFYLSYRDGCDQDAQDQPQRNKGKPKKRVDPTPPPILAPVTPPSSLPDKVPYIPEDYPTDYASESSGSAVPYVSEDSKKSTFWLWAFIAAAVAAVAFVVRRRRQRFDLHGYRYRHASRDSEFLYGGLVDPASSSFEPPVLPPRNEEGAGFTVT